MMLRILMLCFFIASCQSTPQPSEYLYKSFYYNLNKAIEKKEGGPNKAGKHYLAKAGKCLIDVYKNGGVKPAIKDWLALKLLRASKEKEDIHNFFKSVKIYSKNPDEFFENLPDSIRSIGRRDAFVISYDVDLKENTALSIRLDSLFALNSYLTKGDRSEQIHKVFRKYLSIPYEKLNYSEILTGELLRLYEDFGLVGKQSCQKCGVMIPLLYIHISSMDYYEKVATIVRELLMNNLITPNEYAWVYDRNYSSKYGTNYYYFSLNDPPINDENYVSVDDLSEQQVQLINLRRDSIGLPKLPYDFQYIMPASL